MCELESMSPVDDAWRIPGSLWQRIEPLLPEERPHPQGRTSMYPSSPLYGRNLLRAAHPFGEGPLKGSAQWLRRLQHRPSAVPTVAGRWCI